MPPVPAGVGAASWNGNTFCPDQLGGTVQVLRVSYHKLVRDQVPAIIAADGHQAVTRVLDQDALMRRPCGPSCWRRRMKRRRRRMSGNWPRNSPTCWKSSRLSPRLIT
jgi:hypothetical protein